MSVQNSSGQNTDNITKKLGLLQAAHRDARANLVGAGCAAAVIDEDENIQASLVCQDKLKAALTQVGIAKLVRLPIIKDKEKGKPLLKKLEGLQAVACRLKADYFSAAVLAEMEQVMSGTEQTGEANSTVSASDAPPAKRRKQV